MGDVLFRDEETNVVKTFPDFLEKLDIAGTIGLDILKQADILQGEHPNQDKGIIWFLSSGKNKQENFDHNISLFLAANLLFAKGEIQDVPINSLMDRVVPADQLCQLSLQTIIRSNTQPPGKPKQRELVAKKWILKKSGSQIFFFGQMNLRIARFY